MNNLNSESPDAFMKSNGSITGTLILNVTVFQASLLPIL